MERWNEINFILSEKIKPDISEAVFEKHVTEAMRILGWSEYYGDLHIRPSFNIGASNRITPDILVKRNNQNLFAVEIKQPAVPLKSRFADQLTSYLRFLKLEIGVIIGEKIQLLYDDKSTDRNDAFLFEEIEFTRNNPKGKEFTELFSKDSFDRERIIRKANERKTELDQLKIAQKLKTKLLGQVMKSKVKDLIKKELLNDYPDSIVEKVLADLDISVRDASESVYRQPPSYNRKQNVKSAASFPPSTSELKIGEYVRTTFREVLDKIDRTELENLQRADYCKQTFDIQFPFLRKVLPIDTKKPSRYWKNPVQLLGDWYYMCSEWYEVPQNNDRPYYEAWLKKIKSH